MQCGPCKGKGLSREGGPLGICWKHQQTRCQICRSPSTGQELCPPCQEQARLLWLKSRIGQVINPDSLAIGRHRREEKLVQLRHTGYCLADMLAELVRQIIVIVWGDAQKEIESENKKAA